MPEALAKADIRFLVVGEFWEDPKRTEELAERLGVREKLTIVNRFVSDEEAVVYFDASDVFVLPYVSATSTAVIPLAYGYERPVIVTNIPGLTDIVDDGRTGYVVPPQNPSALADALVKFFTSTDRAAFTENVMKKRQELQWSPEKDAIVFHGMS
jgi:glycosyltransferase involved in cell wall biosynthesis